MPNLYRHRHTLLLLISGKHHVQVAQSDWCWLHYTANCNAAAWIARLYEAIDYVVKISILRWRYPILAITIWFIPQNPKRAWISIHHWTKQLGQPGEINIAMYHLMILDATRLKRRATCAIVMIPAGTQAACIIGVDINVVFWCYIEADALMGRGIKWTLLRHRAARNKQCEQYGEQCAGKEASLSETRCDASVIVVNLIDCHIASGEACLPLGLRGAYQLGHNK